MLKVRQLVGAILGFLNKRYPVWRYFKRHGFLYDKPWWLSNTLDRARQYAVKYGFDYREFIGFHFGEKTATDCLEFVNDFEHELFAMSVNDPSLRSLLDDKYLTYEKFKPHYGRECIACVDDSEATKKLYGEFAKRHPRFMLKPRNAAMGLGCRVVEDGKQMLFSSLWQEAQVSETNFSFLAGYVNMPGFVCEELVQSIPELEEFHPASLNTFRIVTVRTAHDETMVPHAFFRMGRGASVVDNAGAGGIFSAVDVDTGVLSSAADEDGRFYDVHPDTGKQIKGYVIPNWTDAICLVKKLAVILDGLRYGAWDLAQTPNGWVVIEVNYDGQFVWQYPERKGFRSELNEWMRLMGLEPMFKNPIPVDAKLLNSPYRF